MLRIESILKGYAIQAKDGAIGTVSDILFDDRTWMVRWVVVDTGRWLPGRKVLIHPSSVGRPDAERREISLALTRQLIKESPSILQDQPVSRQMEYGLYDYYRWDPEWAGSTLDQRTMDPLVMPSPFFGGSDTRQAADANSRMNEGDPHLRSMAAVRGYHIHASDGAIGHLEDFLLDDGNWLIGYLIVDTKNWWFGQHVLISPRAVQEISWDDHEMRVGLTRDQVRASPPWDPLHEIDEGYAKQLDTHYGWPSSWP